MTSQGRWSRSGGVGWEERHQLGQEAVDSVLDDHEQTWLNGVRVSDLRRTDCFSLTVRLPFRRG